MKRLLDVEDNGLESMFPAMLSFSCGSGGNGGIPIESME
jgi:hypothetical protein